MKDTKEAIEADIYYKELAKRQIEMLGIETVKPRKFDTGAQRDSNASKPFTQTLFGYTRLRFGYHMNKGARKYGNFNFTKGIPTDCYLESLDRHLAMYMSGDRTEDHLSAIIFNTQGCMLNEEKEGIDTKYYFEGRNLIDSKALIRNYEEKN